MRNNIKMLQEEYPIDWRMILFPLLAILTACSSKPIKEEVCIPEIVVVTEEVPRPAIVSDPHLPIKDLKPNSSDEDTSKAYVLTVDLLLNQVKSLKEALKPYMKERNEENDQN